jgi:hypothetical protein
MKFLFKKSKLIQKGKDKRSIQNTNTMKIAKQRVSDDLAAQAQQMAFARSNAVTSDINSATNNSMVRAQAADRQMHKAVVMQSTGLSRRNQIMSKNAPGGRVIVETSNPNNQIADRRTEADRLGVKNSVQSQIQNNRRKAQTANPNQDSLSTSERIAFENGPIQQRTIAFAAAPDQRTFQREFQPSALTQNLAQETRNRRKLESKIREMARAK